MKFLKFLLIMFLIFAGIGYGLYYFGTNMASDKVVDVVSAEIDKHGNKSEFKQLLEQDPQVKQFADGGSAKMDQLPFTTKEEATRAVIQKVGLNSIQDIQSKIKNGVSQQDVDEIISMVEGKLTEDEILALKVIAYQEFLK